MLIATACGLVNRDDHLHNTVRKTIWESGRGDKYKLIIHDDVWICHGATIVAPAEIGRGAIVGAGSVVVENVPPYAIVGGVPARVLKMRFTPDEIVEHERLLAVKGRRA